MIAAGLIVVVLPRHAHLRLVDIRPFERIARCRIDERFPYGARDLSHRDTQARTYARRRYYIIIGVGIVLQRLYPLLFVAVSEMIHRAYLRIGIECFHVAHYGISARLAVLEMIEHTQGYIRHIEHRGRAERCLDEQAFERFVESVLAVKRSDGSELAHEFVVYAHTDHRHIDSAAVAHRIQLLGRHHDTVVRQNALRPAAIVRYIQIGRIGAAVAESLFVHHVGIDRHRRPVIAHPARIIHIQTNRIHRINGEIFGIEIPLRT